MKRFIFVLFISINTLSLTGCNDLFEKISSLINSEEPSIDTVQQENLKKDLKSFDEIRTQQHSIFFDLEEKLGKARSKETSTAQLRSELLSFSNSLTNQNDRFKTIHFHTTDVAKMRNTVMQLNYATIQIIQLVDNPIALNTKLSSYLSKQKKLMNDYNKQRIQAEAKL